MVDDNTGLLVIPVYDGGWGETGVPPLCGCPGNRCMTGGVIRLLAGGGPLA